MRKKFYWLVVVMFLFCFLAGYAGIPSADAAVTLKVMNPRGEIPPSSTFSPAPRLTDLAGKTIGIYWIGKAGGNNFWDAFEELLKQKYPTAKIVRYKGPFDLGQKMAETIAKECDTFIYGIGD